MLLRVFLFFIFACLSASVSAQKITLVGKVVNETDLNPVGEVLIQIPGLKKNAVSDDKGIFSFQLNNQEKLKIIVSHVSFINQELLIAEPYPDTLIIKLKPENVYLNQVDVKGTNSRMSENAAIQKLDPISLNELATPFNEFSQIISTLPGVVSNNELSSAYSVRGGNFDENLIYVNGIEIYRPFLIRAGQQEGLSFVNPDLVGDINFSAGGWENKYGDKLSSNLLIGYKEVDSLEGNVNAGLLGASGYVGTKVGEKSSLLIGARYKNARLLFNTFDLEGDYLPRFIDFQAFFKHQLSENTSIELLTAIAQNDYLVVPATRETDFGNFQQKLRFLVVYDGAESLNYRTGQIGARINHLFSERLKTSLIVSAFQTSEQEYRNTEGFYRLCDVDRDVNSDTFDECIAQRGAGSDFQYARNVLDASVLQLTNRYDWQMAKKHLLALGFTYKHQQVNDLINEYTFKDSADFVQVEDVVDRNNTITADFFNSYVQHEWQLNRRLAVNYGFRLTYGSNTDELLLSPRFKINKLLFPDYSGELSFSAGIYRQYPFYRELRNNSGQLNTRVKAQSALHLVTSFAKDLQLWYRPFRLSLASYYKYYFNLIPYDVDNVRIRYRPELSAKGYAAGFDFRLSGEFIPDTESWLSFSVLTTKEDITGDGIGYVRRPSDQRVTASIFFQDHFRNNPSLKVNMKFQVGSGLPFGPPNATVDRNIFTGEWYKRMDVGFSKAFIFNTEGDKKIESFWIGVDVLNVLGVSNTISYSWIEDVNGDNYAIPNSLSARFLNVKGIIKF